MSRTPRLFVVSGPSGAGKGTLITAVREQRPELGLTVSATTRPPREGEVDGISYYFLSDEEFTRRVDAGEFLEWAHVHDHRYGTLKEEVEAKLGGGQSLILELDVHGALNVRAAFEDAVLIFIAPPSMDVLLDRLRKRATEDDESLAIRLETAKHEMELESSYDEIVLNDDFDEAVRELMSVIERHENSKEHRQDVCD